MTLRVAVDLGTSSTCVAISVDGRDPQVVALDGHPLMPSSVFVASDGTVFVGQEADRQAAIDPSRYEPHPKRRIDEAELLLGNTVLAVRDVIRAVLRRAVTEARRVAGGRAADQLVLTHPADWGSVRTRVLRQAANGLAEHIVLVPEPVAAAVFHMTSLVMPGAARERVLAVLDLGGGTVDVSVVQAGAAPAFAVLATRGDPTFGGTDIDQLLLDHVGRVVRRTDEDAWVALMEGRELADRRRRRVVHQDVRGAKETLSRHTYTDVPLPSPFPDVQVTRADLERLMADHIRQVVELTVATVRDAGLSPARLTGVFLVGGSSRIPMISRLLHTTTGVVPTTLDQPETVVARGALRAVGAPPPARTGAPHLASPRPSPPMPTPPVSGPPPPRGPAVPRRWRRLTLTGVVLALVAVLVGLLVVLGDGGFTPVATPTVTGTATTTPSRLIAQYEYRFVLPNGWTQTGGDPAKLRTEVKPSAAVQGGDLVLVEQTRLSFDADRERARAVGKLRADFDAAGETFSDFQENAVFAGRDVLTYRQRLVGLDATVDWYVVLKAHTQVSIGCQYTPAGHDTVRTACQTVVGTMAITE